MPHGRVVGELHHLRDELLAAVVGRVALAGDDDLHRTLRVQQQRLEPFRVTQHQGQPLVGRDPAGEADRQHVRVEGRRRPAQLGLAHAPLLGRLVDTAADLTDQPGPQSAAHAPEFGVADPVDAGPGAALLHLVHADLALGDLEDLPRHPAVDVHAVRDRRDRDLGAVEARPQVGEHLPRHDAVQQRNAVRLPAQPQPHVGHVEDVGVSLNSEIQDALDRDALDAAEVIADVRAVEPVDAGRDRGVGREHRSGADGLHGLVEAEPLLLDQLADAFDPEETGVAFIGVEDRRRRCSGDLAVGPDGPHAADPEQQLLLQAVILAAAVEPVGDQAGGGVVLLDVRVEHQQRYATNGGDPDLGMQDPALRQVERDAHRLPVALEGLYRQTLRIEGRVALKLPTVARERLAEVAGSVEQADADDRDAEVARCLEVVAGQNTETARVLRQDFGDAELRREVADRGRHLVVDGRLLLVPAGLSQIVGEVVVDVGEAAQELAIPGQDGEAVGAHLPQHLAGVAVAGGPQIGVDRLQQLERIGMPRPAQIADDVTELRELRRESGADSQTS